MSSSPYIGIYWTRPVPWAKFTQVSRSAEKAATESRTIRYQRELITRWVKNQGGSLIREVALMDLASDRSDEETYAALKDVAAEMPSNACFVFVNFSRAYGWRQNKHLPAALALAKTMMLDPDPLLVEGFSFDPVSHFRSWKEREHLFREKQLRHLLAVSSALKDLDMKTLAEQAEHLNKIGIVTRNYRKWNADNLRKFKKSSALE